MKLIYEVPLNFTETVFGITGNLLNPTRNGTSQNFTETMFEITRNIVIRLSKMEKQSIRFELLCQLQSI
jgi:hypothetical protein